VQKENITAWSPDVLSFVDGPRNVYVINAD